MYIIDSAKKKIILSVLSCMLGGVCFVSLLGFKLGKIGIGDDISIFNPEDVEIIRVTDDNGEIVNNVDLNIFNNEKFDNKEIIAPKSSGKYQFYVSNIVNRSVKYDIKFTDEMTNKINMKYRLKIDGVYVKGNENEYINIDELNLEDIILMEKSVNSFILEWYWEDDDVNDTYVGSLKDKQYYTLNLKVNGDVLK